MSKLLFPRAPRGARARGFTLLELMISVIIVAILATIAIVSYRKYIQRARTQEAINFLLEIKAKQETHFATYRTYVSTDGGGGVSGLFPTTAPTDIPEPWYIDCTGGGLSASERGWCELGIKPAFGACADSSPSDSGQCTYHQFVTIGWGGAGTPAPAAQFIRNPDQRWWFAIARGDIDQDGNQSQWFLSSEVSEPYNKADDDAI